MKLSLIVSLATILLVSPWCRVSAQGTDLGGGVITRTDVEYCADVTLDVRDIKQFIAGGNTKDAIGTYLNGRNSANPNGGLFTLTQLSTNMANESIEKTSPPFLFQLYGLGGRSMDGTALSGYGTYADSYVRSAIQNGKSTASTAVLVLNVWMYAADLLYKGASMCQKKMEADNPSQFDVGIGGLDEFIALWIGAGQTHGSSEGFGLYALAEQADRLFNTVYATNGPPSVDRELAESRVNQELKFLYQEGASLFSMPDACTKANPDSPKKLWSIINRINTQMYIPLVQMLIVSLLEQDVEATQMYATAVVPQAAQCRPSVFDRLKEELLEGDPNFKRTEIILADLQQIYACLGISCNDIGMVVNDYNSYDMPSCTAALTDSPLALYQPSSDIQPVARIDLDVLQIRILTSLGSFHFAKFWYLYGRNSPRQRDSEFDPFEFYSLSEFAVSTSRQNAEPYYSAFISYHNEPNYADVLIRDTLNGVGKWDKSKSVEQRAAVITEGSAFLVLYLHLIAQINDAVKNCKNIDEDGEYDLTHPWDEVAALTVGSLEGQEEGGSTHTEDGQMIWGLGTRRGYQFQTSNRKGYADVNSDLEDLLFAGRGEIDALQCDMLEKTAGDIKNKSMIPLFQSVLKYAILGANHPAGSRSADIALGEIFALAVIPIVQLYDPAAAQILEENMVSHSDIQPVRGGAQQVADAVGSAASAMGINPREIGSTSEADPSSLYSGASSFVNARLMSSSIVTVGMLVLLL